MATFTILSKEQVEKKEINIFKKIGLDAFATDYYFLLGGCSEYIPEDEETEETLKNRFGSYWLRDGSTFDYQANYIDFSGDMGESPKYDIDIGCRPIVKYSEISLNCYDKKINDGLMMVTYGEYPQYVVNSEIKEILDKKYEEKSLIETGKTYTFYDPCIDFYDPDLSEYVEQDLIEYEYNGKKYIRFVGLSDIKCSGRLSNKEKLKEDAIYWVEVEPVRWYVDMDNDIAISEKVLFSGVQYYSYVDKKDPGDDLIYSTSTIKKYLEKYFSKDIVSNKNMRSEKHKETKDKRKGIRVKNINIEKIQEIVEEQDIELDNSDAKIKAKLRINTLK